MVIYSYNKLWGKIVIILAFLATLGTAIGMSINMKLDAFSMGNFTTQVDDSFTKYYVKPWARGAPFFLGLFLAILYREYKYE